MKPLYFVSFKGKSITSKLQKFFLRSDECSHIAYLPSRYQSDLIEAWYIDGKLRWGFSSISLHQKGTPYTVWELQVPDAVFQAVDLDMKIIARDQVGYDYWGVASFVLKITHDSREKLFCSEGCMRELAKQMKWTRVRPEHVSPIEFERIIQAAGAVIVEVGKT